MILNKVLVLGTGKLARDLVPYLKKNVDKLEFANTFDDNVGSRILGHPVVSINNIQSYDSIIIASSYSEEIIQTLKERCPDILSRVKIFNPDEPFLGSVIYNKDSQFIVNKIQFFFLLPYLLICLLILFLVLRYSL